MILVNSYYEESLSVATSEIRNTKDVAKVCI